MIGIAFATRGAPSPWCRWLASFAPSGVLLGLALACFSGFAAPASAQVPKSFEYYEEPIDLGFKIKVPADWNFIPPTPGDANLIGKFDGNADQGIQIQKAGHAPWQYSVWLVKFDRRSKPGDDASKDDPRISFGGAHNVEEYMRQLGIEGKWRKVDKEGGPLNIAGVDANWSVYAMTAKETPLRLYVASYKLGPDLDFSLIANCSGDEKKWAKFEGAFSTMGKSFKRVGVKAVVAAGARAGDSPQRSRKRAELDKQVRSQPGWTLYETPNYFIISNNPDKDFITELKLRLEAIRTCYEETYPAEKVLQLKKLHDEAEAKRKGAEPKPDPAEGAGETPDDPRSRAKRVDEVTDSRCSVVRVVANRDQYSSYGGPGGSAGYFSSSDEELVIYDDKAVGGRNNTWATMNHEAFHQYIFCFFGNLSPHSWYNEGTGDFYAGYQLKNNRFELKPFDWRVSTIKDELRKRDSGKQTYVPLKELVRYDRDHYYDIKNGGERAGENYAQGWSFIWFLRTGQKNCRA
ncbi:MAG: hypothetical protein ABI054_05045, partial [Planctomycetota bacterium]